MVVLGLLILILTAAIVTIMVMRGGDSVTIDLDSLGSYDTSASVVYLIGVLTVLVGVLGLAIVFSGVQRSRRRRGEMRDLRRRARRADDAERGAAAYPDQQPGETAEDYHGSTPRDR